MNKTCQKLLQKSVDNIHFKAIQAKVNLEAEIEYSRNYLGSPIENKPKYYESLGKQFLSSKVKYLL